MLTLAYLWIIGSSINIAPVVKLPLLLLPVDRRVLPELFLERWTLWLKLDRSVESDNGTSAPSTVNVKKSSSLWLSVFNESPPSPPTTLLTPQLLLLLLPPIPPNHNV
jgi:hypothetical protein